MIPVKLNLRRISSCMTLCVTKPLMIITILSKKQTSILAKHTNIEGYDYKNKRNDKKQSSRKQFSKYLGII